jgi:ATP-binding cassette subfamily B multidrug efflux pump
MSSSLDSFLDREEREQQKIQPNTLLLLTKLMIKHRGPALLGFFMILLGTFTTLLEPRIVGYAIDEAIAPKRLDRLQLVSFVFLLVTSLRVVAAIQQGYLFELLGQKVTQDLRMMLFSHLERLSIPVFDKNPAGRLMTRVTNDIASLNEMFSAGFVSMLSNFLLVVGILAWLMILDLRLGLIAASVFPVMVMISVYFSGRLKVSYRDARSKLSSLNSFLAENLSGMKIVQLFNRQKLHLDRFDRLNQWYADAQVSSIRVFALFQPTITISAGISVALIIWFGGGAALTGGLKLGILVAYFSYILSLFQPVREIADKWNIFLSGMASAERVFSVLAWPTETLEQAVHTVAQPISNLKGHIVFENVWFAYSDEHWVLRDFSLEILPGQKIGVVGHTGAGKTTIISLLIRFYEPQRGRILLDGKDLKDYDVRSLRASIGIVQQEVFLFSGSFEENITFWRKSDAPKMEAVLAALGVNRKNDELLQERGTNFSMGERQVIAFARAMVANPKVWILDEATANMDSDTEALLQKSLDESASDRTSILIAHRLATVKNADRILVIHKGHLVESGNHGDLMFLDGLYARLYRYQSYSQVV